MTSEQAKSTEAVLNMVLKFIFGICALFGWFIVLFKWMDSKTTFEIYKFGSMEGFLSLSIGYVFRHYFGVIRKS